MQISLFLLLGACVAVYFAASRLLGTHDSREPPLLPQKIPFIGHVIGLLRQKVYYYVRLREKYQVPIYSLAIPGGSKIYVVNSIELIGNIQRQPKVLAFPPIEAKFAMTICASSKEANDILKVNTNGDDGDWGYSMEFYKSMHPALSPGAGLDGMNRIMIENVAASLEKLRIRDSKKSTRIGLVKWLRHEITTATTNSVYGPMNPFKDPKVEAAFWDFECNLVMIMMNVLPRLTANKAYRGRQAVSAAFLDYFNNKDHVNGSVLVRSRYDVSRSNKIPVADIARYEVGGAIALLVNTAPAAFWMIFHIYSDPLVLKDCREEITKILTTKGDSPATLVRSLDITAIKTKCPILTSTFQEVLRYRSLGTSVRQVMRDTVLNDQYLLKKDSTILMPSLVLHTDPSIWGPDVSSFNHKRFIKTDSGTRKSPSPTVFRAFGGGTTLCPGRHFATTEILAVVVMMLMRYDLKPVSGEWIAPTTNQTNVAAVIMEPDSEVELEVRPRLGFENGEWAFGLEDSKLVFAVAAEDLASNG